jgi:hypothetical protein
VNATPKDLPFASIPQPVAAPYALASPIFRFRALASLAGQAPLGGAREVVLATYLLARLSDDCRKSKELPAATRAGRAAAARSWLANTALPTPVRAPMTRLAEATEGNLADVAAALAGVIGATSPYLDDPSRLELQRLARAIES